MPDEQFDWSNCLRQVRAGDEDAARALVGQLHDHVEKIVRAHLPRQEEVSDLKQEVFLKVFSRLDQFRGQVPFEHWVARVAVTTCLDRLRSHQRRPVCVWTDLTHEQQTELQNLSASPPPDDVQDRLAWEVLEKLLATLPPPDRLIIQLMELEQKAIAEVMAITGWSSGVVRIRAFRARRRLKKLWQQLEKS